MFTDPNHESPDVIDQRDPSDPSHWDPVPGEPAVTPGITLPTDLPEGWTIAPDGSVVPPAEPAAQPSAQSSTVVLPEMVITGTPPNSSAAPVLLLIALAAGVVLLIGRRP